jgi:formylglycine-generating enzyme required for sulfatase activity
VVNVSWQDARRFCAWLSQKSGQAVRLPSEAEWECACRAGSNREFCFGDDEEGLSTFAWHDERSDFYAVHQVGTRQANAWGLHDLHGNVREWCEDIYHMCHEDAPTDGTAWTVGAEKWEMGSPSRVIRGGDLCSSAKACRSADRGRDHPSLPDWKRGFRPALSLSAR